LEHELFKVKDELRKYVYFFVANAYDPEVFRKLLSFDVILMRNVIMYFTEEARGKIVSMVYDKLASGGYLLVSSSENLLDIYPLFIPEFLSASSSYICWRKP
jgi:chemotaxis protein methyltransferase CheR